MTLVLARQPDVGVAWHHHAMYTANVDKPEHHTSYHYLLDADVAVTERSDERVIEELTIRRHEALFEGHVDRSFPTLPAGTRLSAVATEHGCVLLRNGERLSVDEATDLDQVFSCPRVASKLHRDDDEDAFIGTSQPRRVGESWEMNIDVLSRATGGTVHHAEATLARTTRIDGIEAAELRAFYTARYEGDGVPFESDEQTVYVVPTDPGLPLLRRESKATSTGPEIHATYSSLTERTLAGKAGPPR